jgi:hypothetical protein
VADDRGGEAASLFRRAVTSTGWNTASGQVKDSLAKALASGNQNAAKNVLRLIIQTSASRATL